MWCGAPAVGRPPRPRDGCVPRPGCRRASTPLNARVRSQEGTSGPGQVRLPSISRLCRRQVARPKRAAARSQCCTSHQTVLRGAGRRAFASSSPMAFRRPSVLAGTSRPPQRPLGLPHHGARRVAFGRRRDGGLLRPRSASVPRGGMSRSWTSMSGRATSRPHSASTSPCLATPPTVATLVLARNRYVTPAPAVARLLAPEGTVLRAQLRTRQRVRLCRWWRVPTRSASASAPSQSEPSHRALAAMAGRCRTRDRPTGCALQLDLMRDAAFDAPRPPGSPAFSELPT